MAPSRFFSLLAGVMVLLASFAASSAGIHEMVRTGDLQAVAKTIAANRNLVNAKNELGSTPLHIAAGTSGLDMLKMLLDKGAAVNAKDGNGATPLHVAAFTGHKENLELLLAKGGDVHAKDNRGKTPRDYADTTLNREISDILLIKMLATPAPAARK